MKEVRSFLRPEQCGTHFLIDFLSEYTVNILTFSQEDLIQQYTLSKSWWMFWAFHHPWILWYSETPKKKIYLTCFTITYQHRLTYTKNSWDSRSVESKQCITFISAFSQFWRNYLQNKPVSWCLTIYSHKTHHYSFSKKASSNPLKAPPVNITSPLTKVVVKKQKYFGTG